MAGSDLDDEANGTTTVTTGGITVTLSAVANTGTFNLLSGPDFGINAPGGDDESDAFDNGSGTDPEAMLFSFSTSAPATIDFVSIDFDRITAGGLDDASLAFGGGSSFNITSVNSTGGLFTLPTAESVASDQLIILSWVAGNGFGLEQITLDVTAVPEPSSAIMLLVCGLMGMGQRRKRRA